MSGFLPIFSYCVSYLLAPFFIFLSPVSYVSDPFLTFPSAVAVHKRGHIALFKSCGLFSCASAETMFYYLCHHISSPWITACSFPEYSLHELYSTFNSCLSFSARNISQRMSCIPLSIRVCPFLPGTSPRDLCSVRECLPPFSIPTGAISPDFPV